jgi:hypothetical protein
MRTMHLGAAPQRERRHADGEFDSLEDFVAG